MKKFFLVFFCAITTLVGNLSAVRVPFGDVSGLNSAFISSLLKERGLNARLHVSLLTKRAQELAEHLVRDGNGTVLEDDCKSLCQNVIDEYVVSIQLMAQDIASFVQMIDKPLESQKSLFQERPMADWLPMSDAISADALHYGVRVSFAGNASQLADLVPGEVYQMRSIVQQQAECGCFVKYNVLAIADVIARHEVLSPQSIGRRVNGLLKDAGVANWIDETVLFSDLCEVMSGQNLYMLKIEQVNNGQSVRVVPAGVTTDQNAFSMEEFWTLCESVNEQQIGYFVVNLENSHWVLVVAIKQKGMTGPAFLYLDSQNYPIEKSSLACWLIPYFQQSSLDLTFTGEPNQLGSEQIPVACPSEGMSFSVIGLFKKSVKKVKS